MYGSVENLIETEVTGTPLADRLSDDRRRRRRIPNAMREQLKIRPMCPELVEGHRPQ
jgi:hypothetical protein